MAARNASARESAGLSACPRNTSVVSRRAETVSTDGLVHELLGTAAVRDALVDRWGSEVAPSGEVDRAAVAAVVFERRDELRWLEELLHPLVRDRVREWAGGLPESTAVAVVEVTSVIAAR